MAPEKTARTMRGLSVSSLVLATWRSVLSAVSDGLFLASPALCSASATGRWPADGRWITGFRSSQCSTPACAGCDVVCSRTADGASLEAPKAIPTGGTGRP